MSLALRVHTSNHSTTSAPQIYISLSLSLSLSLSHSLSFSFSLSPSCLLTHSLIYMIYAISRQSTCTHTYTHTHIYLYMSLDSALWCPSMLHPSAHRNTNGLPIDWKKRGSNGRYTVPATQSHRKNEHKWMIYRWDVNHLWHCGWIMQKCEELST